MALEEEKCVFINGAKVDPCSRDRDVEDYLKMTVNRKRGVYSLCGILLVSILLVLLGLTVIREYQLVALRKEMDLLKLDVEDIKQKLVVDGLMDELKGFENQVKAEENTAYPSPSGFFSDNEDDFDEEDNPYDNNGDYDESSSGIEDDVDFLGEVMEAHLNGKSNIDYDEDLQPMKKIMRILKEDIEDESEMHNRSRRDIVAETADGVPILEESYLASRAKNLSRLSSSSSSGDIDHALQFLKSEQNNKELFTGWERDQRTQRDEHPKRKNYKKYDETVSSTASPGPVFTRPSRVMATNEDKSRAFRKVIRVRRPMMRSGPTADREDAFPAHQQQTESTAPKMKRRRKHRPAGVRRNMGLSEDVETFGASTDIVHPKGMLVAHFNGDTSNYKVEHEHYDGNGRLRHPHDVPYTAWSPSTWLSPMGLDDQFPLRDGAVAVPESGIYFVYVQIYFHDEHDTNGYRVYKNNGYTDETILQCTTMTHSLNRIEKSNTCYTAGAFLLDAGDNISIKNIGSMRYSIMEAGKSFFGLIKLADARNK